MAREELREIPDVLSEALPNAMFHVAPENDHQIIAHRTGKMHKNRIRVLAGHRKLVEIAPCDRTKSRITFRDR